MRLFVAVLPFVSGTSLTNDEACRFVGAKLAKTNALCDADTGVCSGIAKVTSTGRILPIFFINPDAGRTVISCEYAKDIVQLSLDEELAMHGHIELDQSVIESLLETRIFPALIYTLTSGFEIDQANVRDMAIVVTHFTHRAHASWSTRLDGIGTVSRFNDLMRSLVRRYVTSPHATDSVVGRFADVFGFWLDLAAIIPDIDLLSREELIPISLVGLHNRPSYRNRLSVEGHAQREMMDVVEIAKAIDAIAFNLKSNEPISVHQIFVVDSILSA